VDHRLEPAPPEAVLAKLRAPFEAFGGTWVEAPVLQPLSLLLDLAGETLRSRLFVVQGDGGPEQALRPDFTIPVVQAHIESRAARGRYLYMGRAFQAAPKESGLPHEFLQIGAELFGEADDPVADDAEVLSLAWRVCRIGGRDDLMLRLGDASLFAKFAAAVGLPETARGRLQRALASPRALAAEFDREERRDAAPDSRLAELLSDLPETEAVGVLEELWRLAGIQPVGGRSAGEIVGRLSTRAAAAKGPKLTAAEMDLVRRYVELAGPPEATLSALDRLSREAGGDLDAPLNDWARRLKHLTAAGAELEAMALRPAYAPAFGYYDGVVFQVESAALDEARPVAAGGRYDALPARLGGPKGAVGCMVRPSRAWLGGAA
jgi:ATP phosphoribosyltransferase regulatory subunit